MIYLPDTNACITLLRNRDAGFIERWESLPSGEIVLCSIVVFELRYGAERSRQPAVEHSKLAYFLSGFHCLPFDAACACRAASLRTALERIGQPIGPYDLQIASIAVEQGLTLVTHNVREFSRVPELQLVDWQDAGESAPGSNPA